jgi:hypothetical protein
MLAFVTVFFPVVLLLAVLALERMERQFDDHTVIEPHPAANPASLRDTT